MKLDLTGTAIDNSRPAAIPINYSGGDVAILTPQGGFFHTSMNSPKVKYRGETLKYGVDYTYVYKSKDIRSKYKISAHGSILLLRKGLSGQIDFYANYLGAEYQLYKTSYIGHITSTEYLLSLYDINSLTDLPKELPPKASILDLSNINRGMIPSVQLIYSIGVYLKDYELEESKPTTGKWWPDIAIDDRPPPIDVEFAIAMGRGSAIPEANKASNRLNLYPLGHLPLGRYLQQSN